MPRRPTVDDLPLMLNARQARILLGWGERKFRRLQRRLPAFVDPDTGTRSYPRDALIEWARGMGSAA